MEADAKATVIIGVWTRGMRAENTAMASLSGYIQIRPGGGQGLAMPGQATGMAASPGPLWVRSDRMGRAVTVVDIHALPEPPSAQWLEGIHFTPGLVLLDESVPEDAAVADIARALPPEAR